MKRATRWDQIRVGSFWSVHGTSWISKAIRWATGQPWNHSGWVVREDEHGQLWTQEALNSIEVNPLSNYRPEFDEGALAVYVPDIPAPVLAYMLAKAKSRVGTRYGWLSTASLLWWLKLNQIAGWLGRQVTTPHRGGEKCSEEVLVAAIDGALEADRLGIYVPDLDWALRVPDREMFTPGDLVAYCEAACRTTPAPAQAARP